MDALSICFIYASFYMLDIAHKTDSYDNTAQKYRNS